MFHRDLEERIKRLEDRTSLRFTTPTGTSGWKIVDNFRTDDVLREILSHLGLTLKRIHKKDFELVKIEEDVKED